MASWSQWKKWCYTRWLIIDHKSIHKIKCEDKFYKDIEMSLHISMMIFWTLRGFTQGITLKIIKMLKFYELINDWSLTSQCKHALEECWFVRTTSPYYDMYINANYQVEHKKTVPNCKFGQWEKLKQIFKCEGMKLAPFFIL